MCSICKVAYIGKTNRHFHVRYNEHLGLSKLTNKPLKYNKQSTTAVREHIRNCNHSASNNDFKIIESDNNPYHLLLKESLSIFMEDPVLNKTVKSFPLELFQFVRDTYTYRFRYYVFVIVILSCYQCLLIIC